MMGVFTHTTPAKEKVEFMVFEYMEKGNLLNLLKVEGRKFETWQLYAMMSDAVQAMCALSAKSIVHRDLACRNLLVDKNYKVKLVGITSVNANITMI
jgi:serine/threonine protein kinase